MDIQMIVLIVNVIIILTDIIAIYLFSIWVDGLTKKMNSNRIESENDSLNRFKETYGAIQKLSNETMYKYNKIFDDIEKTRNDSEKIKSFFKGFEEVCSDFTQTIRKERVEYHSLKEAHKKIILLNKNSPLQKMLDISNAQVEALRRELEESKSQNEQLEKSSSFSRYFGGGLCDDGGKQSLTDDREANRKLALQIKKRKIVDPFGIIKMHELGKEHKPDVPKKTDRRKFNYHAYNTPERMKELRRLKALKKEPIETPKRKVGRPKGSKNKF
jgi:hypothetical protein